MEPEKHNKYVLISGQHSLSVSIAGISVILQDLLLISELSKMQSHATLPLPALELCLASTLGRRCCSCWRMSPSSTRWMISQSLESLRFWKEQSWNVQSIQAAPLLRRCQVLDSLGLRTQDLLAIQVSPCSSSYQVWHNMEIQTTGHQFSAPPHSAA